MLLRSVARFLALSYLIGALAGAIVEYQGAVLSTRFGLPPALIYLTSVIQFVCAFGVLTRFAASAAMGLTATTLGAMGSHPRIGSPLTALPALVYTCIQIWFAIGTRCRLSSAGDPDGRQT